MSQFDFGNLESPLSGETLINGNLEPWRTALHTQHSGNARPDYVQIGMIWVDTSGSPWLIKQFNGSNDITLLAVDTTALTAGLLGGTVEATPIGQTTPAAGKFTTLRYTTDIDFASDRRTKRNIENIGPILNKIMALDPVTFNRLEEGSRLQAGFIAQDIQKVFPDMVSEDENGSLSLHGLDLLAVLAKGIQELAKRVEILEDKQ